MLFGHKRSESFCFHTYIVKNKKKMRLNFLRGSKLFLGGLIHPDLASRPRGFNVNGVLSNIAQTVSKAWMVISDT